MLDCLSPALNSTVTNDPNIVSVQKNETQPSSCRYLLTHREILDFSSCFTGVRVDFFNLVLHSSREQGNHELCFTIYLTNFTYLCFFYQVS